MTLLLPDCLWKILEGTAGLEKYLPQSPKLELLFCGERAGALTHVDLAPPVDVEDHLEVLRVPEEEDDGWMTRDVSITEGRDLVPRGRHGNLAQPGVGVSPQMPHSCPELFPRDVNSNCLPISRIILQRTKTVAKYICEFENESNERYLKWTLGTASSLLTPEVL